MEVELIVRNGYLNMNKKISDLGSALKSFIAFSDKVIGQVGEAKIKDF